MKRKITMRTFGKAGQWGNQVFQYAFLRTYAKRYGLDYEIPPWAGRYLFGHDDPLCAGNLPAYRETFGPSTQEWYFGEQLPPHGDECADHDFIGYAQYHTSWYAPDKDFIRGLFEVIEPERQRVAAAMSRLRAMGKTVVAFHLRRSDAGRMIFFLTPVTWYLRWLREHWTGLDGPVLYIATEDPQLVRYFVHYDPVTMETLGIAPRAAPPEYIYPYGDRYHDLRQLDFFPDWYVMQNCDLLVASDSTFSFTAAWTSRTIRSYQRARLSTQRFEEVDPWNADVSWREHLNDYPGIPGTQMDENPIYGDHWRNFSAKFPSVPLDESEAAALMERSAHD